MITRLHGASSTLVANPRRRRRNPKRGPMSLASKVKAMHKRVAKKIPAGAHPVAYLFPSESSHTTKSGKVVKRRGLSASRSVGVTKPKYTVYGQGKQLGVVKNPRRRKHHKNPRAFLPHYRKRKSHKNPMLEIAGVPVLEMAVGSVGAIAAIAAIQGYVEKQDFYGKLPAAVKDYHLDKAIVPAAIAAGAAFAYKKTSGSVKDIAKYAFIGSVFIALQEVVGEKIKETVKGEKKAAGMYIPANGMYMKATGGSMGGMYLSTSGVAQADMGGLGLYQSKSIYG